MSTQDREKLIAELLARRDSEPFDAQALQALDETQAEQLVAKLDELQGQLRQMPDVPFDEAVWRAHIPQSGGTRQTHTSGWLRFPLATAASVFLVSAVGMFVLFSGNPEPTQVNDFVVTGTQVDTQGMALANLMTRSRDLEQRLSGMAAGANAVSAQSGQVDSDQAGSAMSPAERVLLYRLADVDGQIGRLYESDNLDQAARVELWRQRVDLLENLVVMRGSRQGIRSIYMNDGRSL